MAPNAFHNNREFNTSLANIHYTHYTKFNIKNHIDTVCVSTLRDQSYICRMPPALDKSVVITGTMTQDDLGVLSDLVQTEVEKHLVI